MQKGVAECIATPLFDQRQLLGPVPRIHIFVQLPDPCPIRAVMLWRDAERTSSTRQCTAADTLATLPLTGWRSGAQR
jgi:hypothetical protein